MLWYFDFLLATLFVVLMLPAWEQIYNMTRSAFSMLLFKEILAKEKLTSREYKIIIRHMAHKDHRFLQFVALKRYAKKILQVIKKTGMLSYLDDIEMPIRIGADKERVSRYFMALRNFVMKNPNYFKEVEAMIIDQGQKEPYVIYDFARAIRDLPFSKRVLFMEVSKLDAKLKNNFARKFRKDPEIEKLTSLV
jgi:hypothetical protein